MLVIDHKQRVIGMNPALTAILPGVTRARVGQSLASLDLPHLPGSSDLTLEEEGRRRVFQVDRSPLRDAKGAPGGEIVILTDISQRVELAERLARMAQVDELTKLPNRRAVLERLATEADRLRRYGGTSAVAIADVDHFKIVNDTYGHDAGDAALVHIAQLWTAGVRASDLVARYGGEEFLLLLPETEGGRAGVLLERLRRKLEAEPLEWHGHQLRITASFGLAASWSPLEESVDAVIRRADEALYRAKESGRNRVC